MQKKGEEKNANDLQSILETVYINNESSDDKKRERESDRERKRIACVT